MELNDPYSRIYFSETHYHIQLHISNELRKEKTTPSMQYIVGEETKSQTSWLTGRRSCARGKMIKKQNKNKSPNPHSPVFFSLHHTASFLAEKILYSLFPPPPSLNFFLPKDYIITGKHSRVIYNLYASTIGAVNIVRSEGRHAVKHKGKLFNGSF